MSFSVARLAVRSVIGGDSASNDTTITIMIILLSIVFFGLLLATILLILRRMKQQQLLRETLPQYNTSETKAAAAGAAAPGSNKAAGLTIQTTAANGQQSVLVFSASGKPMLSNPDSPPYSPDNVPEIRITFPDEHDELGHRKSGRVVIVRVGDTTIGMEPVAEGDEQLPAYEKESKGQFYSINMDDIGGLKEKEEDFTRYVHYN